ncbi:unnamed protein product [Leptidea sinapis]|uniref:G-protein coupled receptors family 1 profile domain-containing protein n=1 Tax=Leptidea sinapis TaxID=189913 RepID=A0A5E4Q2E4_9NEOP|nr:unnamed protein product [Leptidea sinapis]
MADADAWNVTEEIATNLRPSELSKFSPGLLTFAAVVTGFIMMIGLFGNLLTVVALLKCPKVRNVAAAFIIRTWSHGGVLCKLVPFLRYGNVGIHYDRPSQLVLPRLSQMQHSLHDRVFMDVSSTTMLNWVRAQ